MTRKSSRTLYTARLAERICRDIAAGVPLKWICARPEMPSLSTVKHWRRRHRDFAARYLAARKGGGSPRPPVRLSDTLFSEICQRLADGEFLVKICRDRHMPSRNHVHRRIGQDPDLARRYAAARALQAEHLFEEIIAIADGDDDARRARLRIETRKWLVMRLAPRLFGDMAADPADDRDLAAELIKAAERVRNGD